MAPARYLDLQEGAVNVIRQEARGFVAMSESTLATEPEFRPVHVRRLLMLLRRLALREGATYVFEPNSLVFRRQVQRGFEDILATLFLRGAFGGATAESSYQVDVSDRLNPPSSVDEGRLIVEIRVAPSQPLMFLTVRLVLTGANGLLLQEGLS
jgi:phage tail sheath protein FI